MKPRMMLALMIIVVLTMVLASCAQSPTAPAPVADATSKPDTSATGEPLAVVPASELPATSISADMLILAQTGAEDFALGPRSAFPTDLPLNAAVLVNQTNVPANVTPAGNVHLNEAWPLSGGEVIKLTLKDIPTPEPSNTDPHFLIKPTSAGILATGASTPVASDRRLQDFVVELERGSGNTAKCNSIKCWFCLFCGCCGETPPY